MTQAQDLARQEFCCRLSRGEEHDARVAPAFSFRLIGSFYSGPLYDEAGREVTSLANALRVVEEVYSEEWAEVFNGLEGRNRDDT